MPTSPRAPEIGFPTFSDSIRASSSAVLLDERREPAQQPAPVGRRDGTPAREAPSARADRRVGLLDAGALELRDRLLRRRVDDRQPHGR